MTRFIAAVAFVYSAAAQTPVVGDINLYGLHKIAPARILSAIEVKTGAPLPPSKGEMEDTLDKIPGVVNARVEAVCCDGPRVSLFIGIEERGAAHAAFRSDPVGDATLPSELLDQYRGFVAAVGRAAGKGNAAEDLTAGHSLMADPEARAFQQQFQTFAGAHLEDLRNVLRNGSEAEQRAVAAAVIDYADSKKGIVDDLQYALQDPDESVRANAARSLMAIAILGSKQPALGIHISPTWFIQLLNSVVLSDRLESAKVLLTLTDSPNATVLEQLREQALPSLVEMARWKTPRYALPSFLLLGRLAGLTDGQVRQNWEKEDREAVIEKALNPGGRKRG
ncbi:MAG TPA: HEAT repeat domain-containing protein [Bryobacteraceae bacterium]